MNLVWTKNLKGENKSNFEVVLNNSSLVVNRVLEILKERKEVLDRSETSEDAYNSPSWGHLQAHRNGRREELEFLIKLFTLKG